LLFVCLPDVILSALEIMYPGEVKKEKGICRQHQYIQDVTINLTFTLVIVISMTSLIVFNYFKLGQCHEIVMKLESFLVNAVFTAALCVFHFPISFLHMMFLFPLILNAVPIFGFSKTKTLQHTRFQWATSHIIFIVWVVVGILFLFGTVL